MAVTRRASASGTDASPGAQIVIPGSVASGDLLIAVVEVNSTSYTTATPAGWTRLQSAVAGSQYADLFVRRATGGDATTTVEFTVSPTGSKKASNLVAYYASTGGQFVNVVVSGVRAENATGTTHLTPTINVPAVPSTNVAAIGKKGTTVGSITAPAGYTLHGTPMLTSGASNNGTAFADQASGGTGNTSATWTTDVSSAAATTFLMNLSEGALPPVPVPVLREWDGSVWNPAP